MHRSSTLSLAVLALAQLAAGTPIGPHEPRASPLATVYSSCKKANNVALTFDDGPYIYIQSIVNQLDAVGAKGSFFMNGYNYDCIYNSARSTDVQYAYNHGHMIGSHTWSHGDLTSFSTAQIQDGMYRMEEAFSRILGLKPAFMRPPYGDYNDNVREIAYARNQSLALWDQDTGDADGASVAASKQVYTDAVNDHLSTMLVLNHETIQTTSTQVLPYALPLLINAGYELVTLAECLGVSPYAAIGVPQTRSSSWTCDGTPEPGDGCGGSITCKTGTPTLSTSGSKPTSTTSTKTTSSTKTTTTTTSKTTVTSKVTTTTTTKSTTTTSKTTTSKTTTSSSTSSTGKVIKPYASSSLCLTASSNTDGNPVTVQKCISPAPSSQLWTYTGVVGGASGAVKVYGSKCLDVTDGDTDNGTKLQIYGCGSGGVGDTNQQWSVTTDQRIAWTNMHTCMDLTGGSTTAGTVVQSWHCTANDNNQVWIFS